MNKYFRVISFLIRALLLAELSSPAPSAYATADTINGTPGSQDRLRPSNDRDLKNVEPS